MARIARILTDPQQPESLVQQIKAIQTQVDGKLEFGSPQDPNDPSSVTLANGIAHNGTLVNLLGSWFSVNVTALDTKVDCIHNLGVPVTVLTAVNQPNVLWPAVCYRHDGTGATGASTFGCNYETGDAASITVDSFPLRFYSSSGRTVDGDHPLRVDVFFIPGVR